MDPTDGQRYEINMQLVKCMGLYRILDPSTTKIFSYNAYHIAIVVLGLLCIISIFYPICFYYLTKNVAEFSYYLGYLSNYLLSFYKIIIIVYYSDDIWKCIEIISPDSMSYKHYNKKIFEKWRRRSVNVSYVYVLIIFVILLSWYFSPYVYYKTMDSARHHDSPYSSYLMNIFNLYSLKLDQLYSERFSVLYIAETNVLVCFLYFSTTFDTFMVLMCFAMFCQLETICDGIESLVQDKRPKNNMSTYNIIYRVYSNKK